MICIQCAQDKPAEAFHPDRRYLTGYNTLCEACFRANLPTSMVCTACGSQKPLEEYAKYGNTQTGRQQPCKTCHIAAAREKRLAASNSRAARWLKTSWVCRDCGLEKPITDFRASHKSRMGHIQPCRACCRAKQNAWLAAHPEKVWARNHRRLSRRNQVPFAFTKADHTVMMQYWGYSCAACGREEGLFNQSLCMDHWIPLTHPSCPGTIPANIVPLCSRVGGCNSSKNQTEPVTWLKQRFGPRKAARILKAIETYFDIVRARQQFDNEAAD